MAALRFALAPALKALRVAMKDVFPYTGKNAGWMYAQRFGPELMGAGMMAAAAPPDTSVGTRAAIGGEDVLASLGLSVLGSLGGRGLMKGRMARRMKAGKVPELVNAPSNQVPALKNQLLREAAIQGANVGDMAMMPAQFMRPSPLLNAAHDDYIRKQEEAYAQSQVMTAEQLEERMKLEGLMELLLAGGGVAAGVPLLRSPLANV